jgi:iron complex transport system ATP-binding protein
VVVDEDVEAHMTSRLSASGLQVGYDKRLVIDGLSVKIPDNSFTVIVGPNACGKSTLLRALSRTLPAAGGTISLDGRDIATLPTKEVARRLGLLPQTTVTPEGITVLDLVSRGRFPHQRFLRQWTADDQRAVDAALAATQISDLALRPLDELSGGQRQRAWLAMVLAQQTRLLMLDEPTTFLDIAHQLDVLDLCCDLQELGYTLVAVLHDLNQAARYASHLICMSNGAIVAAGTPQQVVTAERIQQVFGIACEVVADPQTGTPMVIPLSRAARSQRYSQRAGDTPERLVQHRVSPTRL